MALGAGFTEESCAFSLSYEWERRIFGPGIRDLSRLRLQGGVPSGLDPTSQTISVVDFANPCIG